MLRLCGKKCKIPGADVVFSQLCLESFICNEGTVPEYGIENGICQYQVRVQDNTYDMPKVREMQVQRTMNIIRRRCAAHIYTRAPKER